MRKPNAADPANKPPVVRCAIYTRKSTEEGLEQEFNSLDAQREAAEAYVKSQAHGGWICLPDRYDDGGFTGGNLDRPALQRVLADIEQGKVDAVITYKVDRLSRSLLDFSKMMEVFDRHQVSFVSVTQQFNTATSMGRLVLNVLLSFAQFEREIISERTRDKIAATRRKGKWAGGTPLLGYDVAPRGTKLLVNEEEAVRVRAIFALYLEHQALLPVVQELSRRGWTTKRWVNKAGRQRGGRPFDRTNLYRLLTNVVYLGKVRYKDEVHAGEQPALVDAATWEQVQALLRGNGRSGGGPGRSTRGFLLQGLLRCTPCACAMTPSHTRRGCRRYRYYVCTRAQKRGWDQCPSKSIPAGQIEAFVVDQIGSVARDLALFDQIVTEAYGKDEGRRIESEVQRCQAELRAALTTVEARWQTLMPQEQARVLDLLVQRVDYNGAKETVAITFHPTGFAALARERAAQGKERSA
jgi:site-specific DNA recombinase